MSKNKSSPSWPDEQKFPDLNAEWFRARGVGDPEWVYEEWCRWLSERKRSNQVKFRRALELAVGVQGAAVGFWLTKEQDPDNNRADQLSRKTLKDLDAAASALGWHVRHPVTDAVDVGRGGVKRIVVLAQLAGVPSPRYHLSVLESIVRSCDEVNLSVALHEVSQSDPDMASSVERVVRSNFPHGVIWFRLTPSRAALEALRVYSDDLPCVLVHASRLQYPYPAIAHVIPVQAPIRAAVARWVRGLTQNGSRTVVVAAMESEELTVDFPLVDPTTAVSIRAERLKLVVQGINDSGCEAAIEHVEDYGANRAMSIAATHPAALGYICFSDEIAVGLHQLQEASGRDIGGRILGFDGSELAKRHKIPSFDQGLADIGKEIVEEFLAEFRRPRIAATSIPACREIGVELGLPNV